MKVYRLGAVAHDAQGNPYLCTIDSITHEPPGMGWTKLWQPTASVVQSNTAGSPQRHRREASTGSGTEDMTEHGKVTHASRGAVAQDRGGRFKGFGHHSKDRRRATKTHNGVFRPNFRP
jgi:hypothetical protein